MKKYVVDTNVISESIKPSPNSAAISWLESNSKSLYLTSITIEELRFGALMMPKGKKRKVLEGWIDSLSQTFSRKILSFDIQAAEVCAKFHEKAISSGRTPTIEDLMIAAIAKCNGCIVVSRNVKDFEYLDIEVINPFDA